MGSEGGRPWIGLGFGVRLLRRSLPALALLASIDPSLAAKLIGAKGSETGSGASGYGRIVLNFDKPVSVKAKLAGGVLLVGYGERVAQGPEHLADELPAYVSSVRRDPDAADLFDELDTNARAFGEISCISKRDGRLVGSAKDPLTARLALEELGPQFEISKTSVPGGQVPALQMKARMGAEIALDKMPAQTIGAGALRAPHTGIHK